ncbi:saccharopine dehydrogenase family protein [Deinococcus radiophilus]|uniref:Saccharopine dehydrogenase family protein n=1 Tax=Deinococcus radiophilus TaxID=32062 RepID=A0A3S0KDH3_9DEIO|nr:saccharopine dehydrogenase family protein [Deinococcus radiophilus]RTR28318.1 saccharopine dehydrogenase family protein [Deinococcus radiophilus]UFA51181.1 saccharopine dehydrogenase family protein [Deinococcus radiophilus]
MSKVIIIGAGGVANVTAKKCAQNDGVFSEVLIATRTVSKADRIVEEIGEHFPNSKTKFSTATVDADNVPELVKLIEGFGPEMVINLALPYQDLTIMDACLETGVHYLDTANYEPKDVAKFEYSWQWAYQERFKEKGLMALLGCGFDPGATQAMAAYHAKHHFDEMHYLDIVDCNNGDHGKAFATNFNPEINIREITANGRYFEDGEWVETAPLEISQDIYYPKVATRKSYVLYHEELESLVKNFPTIKRARFWMTFGDPYIKHLNVLEGIGMTSIEPIDFKGQRIAPIEFLKAVLPAPESLAANYTGQTCIGVQVKGKGKDGEDKVHFIYNVTDHAETYKEVQAQGISYTTGVPAMIGAMLMLRGEWMQPGVWNVEQLDPDPFFAAMNRWGLPLEELSGIELVK